MRSPLPLVALLYAAGLVLARYIPARLPGLFLVSFALVLLSLLAGRRRRIVLCLLLPLAGWTNFVTQTISLSPWDLRRLMSDRIEYVTIRGIICEAPVLRVSERRGRVVEHSVLDLQVQALRRNTNWQPAFGRVTTSTPGVVEGAFFSGQAVEVTGVLQRPKGPTAPGQFDYRAYLMYRGVFYQLRCESTNDWQIVAAADRPPASPPWSEQLCPWGQRILAKGLVAEDESLKLLWAMVLGWKTALTPEVSEPFMQSGTLHIFAISGLHIALIAGILVSVLRVMRVSRGVSGLLVIPLIWFYTAATGWQASAIRSTVMMTVIIAGWALERPSNLINSLAAAGLIILIWDPTQLFQASFQLSFFVVLGLALIVPPLERVRRRLLQPDPLLPPELRPRWKRWLDPPTRCVASSFATSLAAWIGSMPLIAYYFYMITPGSLLANLVIVPLSSLALMSCLGSLVCGDWFPFLTELFNNSAWLAMFLMIRSSEWFASLPGAYFYVPQPGLLDFVIYYLILSAALSGVFLVPGRRVWAGAGVGALLAVWGAHCWSGRNGVTISVLPVPGGATFIDVAGRSGDLLIDCSDSRSAETLVKPFLRSQGVNRLPAILLSHGNVQHIGGTELIASHFRARQIVTSSVRFRSPAYRDLVSKLEKSPGRWRKIQKGQKIGPWTVLHPATQDRFAQGDDNVVVLRGQYHGTRIVLLSNLGRLGQRTLLERETDLRADILVAGPPTQGEPVNDSLLEAVKPRLLIIAGSDFPASARPSGRLRERLAKLNIPVVYTSDSGAAKLVIDSAGWRLTTMKGGAKPEIRGPKSENSVQGLLPNELPLGRAQPKNRVAVLVDKVISGTSSRTSKHTPRKPLASKGAWILP
jgi:competence protein ComEC